MNFRLICLISVLFFIGTVSATPKPYPGPGYQSHKQYSPNQRPGRQSYYEHEKKSPTPIELLEKSIGNTMAFLAQPKAVDYNEITHFVINEMAPNFDFNYMSRWIAGRHYQRFSQEQKEEFTKTFTELFISTFVQKLRKFKPALNGAEVFRSRRVNRNEVIANAQIMGSKQQKVNIDFRFINTPSGWKVVDVKANGISALMYYRQYFAKQMRQRRT